MVELQQRLSFGFDRLILPAQLRIDGNTDFATSFVPPHLHAGMTVFDIGGGSSPFVTERLKQRLDLEVIGLDIDSHELARAPARLYDRTIHSDVCDYSGHGEADLVICRSVLEHIRDTQAAVVAIARILRPGGVALVFVPSENAVFARLNRLLPERVKRYVLFTVFPDKRETHGFPAFYDRCTPRDFNRHARYAGLSVESSRCYFTSSYFSFCFPAYVLWRLWVVGFRAVAGDQAAETYALALRKPVAAD
jgi:SAM-dependent methyltransferase